jgi:hypothetical protein
VLDRADAAAARVGRHPAEVRLVAVTKAVPAERILEAIDAGLRVFGENYVQEATRKIAAVQAALPDRAGEVVWHFIGKLQRNKARLAVGAFEAIHSVDSLGLAREIDKRARAIGRTQSVFLEVNVAGEATKAGFTPEAVLAETQAIEALRNLRLLGLMAVPPAADDPEESRPHFRALRALHDEIRRRGLAGEAFRDLSMGMSYDFEVAIEEGATWIRIGTAIFGERPKA